jgi:cytochrome c2
MELNMNIKLTLIAALISLPQILFANGPAGRNIASDAKSIAKGKATFNTKCIACHTIGGGKRLGPDLKDVTKRRKVKWLIEMIKNPDTFVKTDKAAMQIAKDFNNMPMTNYGFKDSEVKDIIAYLKSTESKEEKKPKKPKKKSIKKK